MANFTLAKPNEKHVWSNEVTKEYVRGSGLLPYMGKGGIIDVKNELGASAGNVIHNPVLSKLRGSVVRGNATLVGSEDVQSNYSVRITTDIVRTAVVVPLSESFKTEMDLFAEGKMAVTNRLKEAFRDDLITAMRSVPVSGTSTGPNPEDTFVTYEAATTTQQNLWQAANADRVLYGALKANFSAGNHATSIATINASGTTLTNNKLSAKSISLARKLARSTTNSSTFGVNPYMTTNGSEWYVMFVDSNGFRDCKFDPTIYAANKDARPRETDIEKNPIFSGANILFYDGVIICEIPELPVATTNVGYAHLCGLQSLMVGWSKKITPVRRAEDDYQMLAGVGAIEIRGQTKATVNLTQVGMVSVFHSSVDDA